MHVRRVLLLMAMVLLLTAAVVAITPPKRRSEGTVGATPAPAARSAPPRNVDLRFPPAKRPPTVRLVQGDHALVRVSAAQAGDASVMGLTDSAEPGTPATFDLLARGPASYAVTFTPVLGSPRRIATIEVRP
jgi:hypothetical protein